MIFVKVNATSKEIEFIHYKPFDKKLGMNKTEDELLKIGMLIDSMPVPEQIQGKVPFLKFNGTDFYYEYEDIPITPEEKSQQEIKQLKTENETLLSAVSEMTEYIATQDARLTDQENAITELSTLIANGGI